MAFIGGVSPLPAAAEGRHALLVGISDYGNPDNDPDRWSDISGANDITLLSPLLESQGFTVTSLADSAATYSAITSALSTLTGSASPGDMVYLHFSMHGQPFEDLDGDEADGWDEALIPVDARLVYTAGVYEGENHLLDDELEKYISALRTCLGPDGDLIVVLDACHSGTASRGTAGHIRGVREGFTRSGLDYYPDTTTETNDYFEVSTSEGQSPVTFVEACRSYQVNREVRDPQTDIWYGSVSYYMAKALAAHPLSRDMEWLRTLRAGFSADRKLRRQNLVVESSGVPD